MANCSCEGLALLRAAGLLQLDETVFECWNVAVHIAQLDGDHELRIQHLANAFGCVEEARAIFAALDIDLTNAHGQYAQRLNAPHDHDHPGITNIQPELADLLVDAIEMLRESGARCIDIHMLLLATSRSPAAQDALSHIASGGVQTGGPDQQHSGAVAYYPEAERHEARIAVLEEATAMQMGVIAQLMNELEAYRASNQTYAVPEPSFAGPVSSVASHDLVQSPSHASAQGASAHGAPTANASTSRTGGAGSRNRMWGLGGDGSPQSDNQNDHAANGTGDVSSSTKHQDADRQGATRQRTAEQANGAEADRKRSTERSDTSSRTAASRSTSSRSQSKRAAAGSSTSSQGTSSSSSSSDRSGKSRSTSSRSASRKSQRSGGWRTYTKSREELRERARKRGQWSRRRSTGNSRWNDRSGSSSRVTRSSRSRAHSRWSRFSRWQMRTQRRGLYATSRARFRNHFRNALRSTRDLARAYIRSSERIPYTPNEREPREYAPHERALRQGRDVGDPKPARATAPRAERDREQRDVEPEENNEPRFYLAITDDVVEAPSIGPKTARRLRKANILTVKDLLEADIEAVAKKINARHITAAVLDDWQDQARLVCTIPWLRGTHAQLLVGAGFRDAEAINAADQGAVLAAILRYATTKDGQRLLRNGAPPAAEKINAWVEHAGQADLSRAA